MVAFGDNAQEWDALLGKRTLEEIVSEIGKRRETP